MSVRKKVLMTGARGMLGRTLARRWTEFDLICLGSAELDVTDKETVQKIFRDACPDIVVHCAAVTRVDDCEHVLRDEAHKVNGQGSANVAHACAEIGARLIGLSTDYVFDGDSTRPYREDDVAAPQTEYGKSKREGELAIFKHAPDSVVVRVAWLYGQGGPSFFHTMLRLGRGDDPTPLRVVHDQIGCPTSCDVVADGLRALMMSDLCGVVHLTTEGEATWFEFTREIFRQLSLSRAVEPCDSADFPRPARRPANSRLENARLRNTGIFQSPDWKSALADFIKHYEPTF